MKNHSRNLVRPALALAILCLLSGCSTFERDWEAMTQTAAPTSGMEGRWKGVWVSEANSHNGGLRCIITREEDDSLLACYHATYGGFFTFEYDMLMEVRADGETYRFSAEADLGWLAGRRYVYDGTVVGDEFHSTYKSSGDHGRFQMQRVK